MARQTPQTTRQDWLTRVFVLLLPGVAALYGGILFLPERPSVGQRWGSVLIGSFLGAASGLLLARYERARKNRRNRGG